MKYNTTFNKDADDFCKICPVCKTMTEFLYTEYKPETGLQPAKKESRFIECKFVPKFGKETLKDNTECPVCQVNAQNPLWRIFGVNIETGERQFLKTETWIKIHNYSPKNTRKREVEINNGF